MFYALRVHACATDAPPHLERRLQRGGVVAPAPKHEAGLLLLQVNSQLLDLVVQLERAAHQVGQAAGGVRVGGWRCEGALV